jgi:hypothetical protein
VCVLCGLLCATRLLLDVLARKSSKIEPFACGFHGQLDEACLLHAVFIVTTTSI